jgi:branched-chain amino acid transport system substrate-binding protein
VHYIVGEICSKASIPISEIAEAKHVVQISPTSTNPQVTLNTSGSTKQYVFRACFIDPFQGTVMAGFALQKGYKTAFVMRDPGNSYSQGLADAFSAAFEQGGGKIVGKGTYASGAVDFSAILGEAAGSQAGVLFVPDTYNTVNRVGKQAREKGLSAVLMGGDGWDSPDLDLQALDGGFFSTPYSPLALLPAAKTWAESYSAKYGTAPDGMAALAYDAANLLLTAIQQAGVDDPAKVKDTLAAITFEGVTGQITFDHQHNPVKSAVVLHIAGGKIEYGGTVNP